MPPHETTLGSRFTRRIIKSPAASESIAAPGSEITVQAHRDTEQMRILVQDEGEGLPEEDCERVFDKFYRVWATDKKHAGTGLGLAIGRGFMEAMGGTITAANRNDRNGAVFILTLPIVLR